MQQRRIVQADLFGDHEVIDLPDGTLVDSRMVEHIDQNMRYHPREAAHLIGVSVFTIYKMCERPESVRDKHIDERHFHGFDKDRNYFISYIAHQFSCSHTHISRLARIGELMNSPARKAQKITGWSVIDFIARNATHISTDHQLEALRIGSAALVIPGWSLRDHILKSCTKI